MASTALTRPRRGRIVAGVCLSLARRFGVRPWQMRALFVISCLLPGPQVLLYLALWVIMPSE
jgi:phage shock protein PspC (stress-responsive transcriptional regulator)